MRTIFWLIIGAILGLIFEVSSIYFWIIGFTIVLVVALTDKRTK